MKNDANTSTLRALRINWKELLSVGILFSVTILSWCITEYSTTLFRTQIETELQNITASDISVSSSLFPEKSIRESFSELAKQYGARFSESVEFSYTLEKEVDTGSNTASGSRFLTTNIRIIDTHYPLYGDISYSGSYASGALSDGEIYDALKSKKITIQDTTIPITGILFKAPGVSENPFATARDILIPNTILPFEAITASGTAYRVRYRMEFALSSENRKSLYDSLQSFVKTSDKTSDFRVREEQSAGGNFSDIANTLNDFLGSILYATVLIALSSFIVSFSRFALERRKLVKTLLWLGLREAHLLRLVFFRFLGLFLSIGIICLSIFAFLPNSKSILLIKGILFLTITIIAGIWILSEILLKNVQLIGKQKFIIRAGFSTGIVLLLGAYLFLSGESFRPLVYALLSVVILERFSTVIFRIVSLLFSQTKNTSKSRFFLLDALRSFRSAPVLGKVSFSVFFLLSATLTAVFLFSLAFQEILKQTTDSRVNTFVINLLPADYKKLSEWIPKEDFYSTLRARIVSVNGKTLEEHLGTTDVSREFSREFNITDGETKNQILTGKRASDSREVTIDYDFSKMLGVSVGTTIEFSLAGRKFPFTIVGIRESKRNGTTPFFYFQIPEDAIEGAPKTYFLATEVTGDQDAWKKRIIAETGAHVSFLNIGSILEQVRSYSRLVLQGVLALFAYIGAMGLLAFLTAEKSFFLLKVRKIQLYRILGATKSDGFQLLFYESILGNIIPLLTGSIVGTLGLLYFLRNSPILKITPSIGGITLLTLVVFFMIAYFYARHSVRAQIGKTEPRIGGVE